MMSDSRMHKPKLNTVNTSADAWWQWGHILVGYANSDLVHIQIVITTRVSK